MPLAFVEALGQGAGKGGGIALFAEVRQEKQSSYKRTTPLRGDHGKAFFERSLSLASVQPCMLKGVPRKQPKLVEAACLCTGIYMLLVDAYTAEHSHSGGMLIQEMCHQQTRLHGILQA